MGGRSRAGRGDYSITYHGDAESGSFSLVAEGTADAIVFDAERSFTHGEQEGVYEALVSVGGEAGLLSDAGVQSDMAEVWSWLWGMLGEGVTLLVVLENLYH